MLLQRTSRQSYDLDVCQIYPGFLKSMVGAYSWRRVLGVYERDNDIISSMA